MCVRKQLLPGEVGKSPNFDCSESGFSNDEQQRPAPGVVCARVFLRGLWHFAAEPMTHSKSERL